MRKTLRNAVMACVWLGAANVYGQDLTVVVNGKPVVTPLPGLRAGSELYLCMAPIARALGAQAILDRDGSVHLRRADGVDIIYDVRTGEIRAGSILLGMVKADFSIRPGSEMEQLLLPVSAIVPMLQVTVRRDEDRNIVFLDSVVGSAQMGGIPSGLQLADLNYAYGVTTNGSFAGQTLNLGGQAIQDGMNITSAAQMTRTPQTPIAYINHAQLRADWDSARSLIVGDQAVFTGIDGLASSLRGVGYQQKLAGWRGAVYAGRAIGMAAETTRAGGPPHDTDMAGLSLTHAGAQEEFTVGAGVFRNGERRGVTTGSAFRLRGQRNHFSVQGAAGDFAGSPFGPGPGGSQRVNGLGYGISVADSFTPSRALSLTAEWERYSPNFLTARPETRYSAASAASASVSIRPLPMISLTGSASDRTSTLGVERRLRSYGLSLNVAIPGRHSPQLGVTRSAQNSNDPAAARFVLTQYSAVLPGSGRYTASVFYAETRLGKERYATANAAGGVDLKQYGRIGFQFQAQGRNSQRIGADWNERLGERGAYLRLGADRITVAGRTQLAPVIGARVPAPWGQWLDVSYRRDFHTQFLQAQLAGRLIRKRELNRNARGVARIQTRATLTGQVCVDVNSDGTCDSSDRPLADVTVWRDDSAKTRTDASGWYRFEDTPAGAHTIRVDLAGVPAGFVFDGQGTQTINVQPGRPNRQDFRVIRTGQIEGKVVYLDYSNDSEHPTEAPYPDARIVATGDRDTFSEANGIYLLGDLPPGSYELRLDPSTLPKGYVPAPAVISVTVKPGSTTRVPVVRLAIPPKAVIEKRATDQIIDIPTPARKEGGKQ